jgi:hypothetical protein
MMKTPAFASIFFTFLLFGTTAPNGAIAQSFEFSFWPSPTASADPRVKKIVEHPCGSVAIAKVQTIPAYKRDGVLIPERVLETGPTGKVVRRWVMPVDGSVRGIIGDKLIIAYDTRLYQIGSNGRVALWNSTRSFLEPELGACKIPAELLPSDYAVCGRFTDLSTGKSRQLSYEDVCS